jgi:VWFA-related protein
MRGKQSPVRRSGFAVSALLVLFIGACCPLHSQSANSTADLSRGDDGILTFRAGTHLVVLDVDVIDKKGHPVPGLTKEDFELFEDGHPQTIKFFEEYAPLSASRIAQNKAELAASLPPNTFTSYEPFTNNAVTILMLNELVPVSDYDLAPLHLRMIDVIRNAPPDTPFAIYELDSQLRLIQPITTDREVLLSTIERIWKNQHFSLNMNPTASQVLARRDTLTGTMHKLGKTLESIPGRKTLFAFTGGLQCSIVAAQEANCRGPWPLGNERRGDYLCSVMDILEQGRISIYRYYPDGQVVYGFGCRGSSADLRHIFDTTSNYYTLYYTPTNGDWNGKYRKFKVSVGDTALHLSYRAGYYGNPENALAQRGTATASSAIAAGIPPMAIPAAFRSGESIQGGPSSMANPPPDPAPDPSPVVFTVQITPAASVGSGPQATPPAPGDRESERLRLQGYRDYSIRFIVPAKGLKLAQKTGAAPSSGPASYSAMLAVSATSYVKGNPADSKTSRVSADFSSLSDPRIAESAITTTLSIQVPEHGGRLLHLTVHDLASNQFGRLDIPIDKIVLPQR